MRKVMAITALISLIFILSGSIVAIYGSLACFWQGIPDDTFWCGVKLMTAGAGLFAVTWWYYGRK